MSHSPGSTVMPSVEMTFAPSGTRNVSTVPTARTRSPSMRMTLSRIGSRSVPSTSVPPTSAVTGPACADAATSNPSRTLHTTQRMRMLPGDGWGNASRWRGACARRCLQEKARRSVRELPEHPVDVALPRAVVQVELAFGRGDAGFGELHHRLQEHRLVGAVPVQACAPAQAVHRDFQRAARQVEHGTVAERQLQGLLRNAVAQRVALGEGEV